jgi:hypothetical protein
MNYSRNLGIILLALVLGCGCASKSYIPTKGEGRVDSFEVISGTLSSLQKGAPLLVLGPFKSAPNVYPVCRGEEANTIADSFNDVELFAARFRFIEEAEEIFANLKEESPKQLRTQFNLPETPELVLYGELLEYKVTINVFLGVLKKATYRLTFHNLKDGSQTIILARIDAVSHYGIPALVDELSRRIDTSNIRINTGTKK